MSNKTLINKLRATAEKLLEQAKLLEVEETQEPEPWVPPRTMICEVRDGGDMWEAATIKNKADFNDEYPYETDSFMRWQQCRPLQDPLVFQFRPHTPGDPRPSELASDTRVVFLQRNGRIWNDKASEVEWDKRISATSFETIGWLHIVEHW